MKIICIGDSFTRGYGVKKRESWINQPYNPDIQLINMGINGDTTSGMLARFQRDVIDYSPDFVLITGCVNDFISGSSLDIPQNNYMAMIHQATHHNIIPIVGISPGFVPSAMRHDWAEFSNFDLVLTKHIQFRAWLQNFCKTFDLMSLDFYEVFEEIRKTNPNENFFLDGLHLTESGHQQIAQSVFDFFDNLYHL